MKPGLAPSGSRRRPSTKVTEPNEKNCRSLHSAPPDFLWSVVALIEYVHLSLRKGAYVALSGAAWEEIRVRCGRDDKVNDGVLPKHLLSLEKRNPNLHPSQSREVPRLVFDVSSTCF
jgi:hypothetical protein